MIPKEICQAWTIDESTVRQVGNGLIHISYHCTGGSTGVLLQRLNHHVFPRPQDITDNILLVLDHLRRIEQSDLVIPELIRSTADHWTELDPEGNTWRAYAFIPGTVTYAGPVGEEVGFHAARAFGVFGKWLRRVPETQVIEVLPDFHNTPVRFAAFQDGVQQDPLARACTAKKEIEYLTDQARTASKLTELIRLVPSARSVCHNDAKVPNLLMDVATNRPKAVVDLDTLMPGTVLYDLGDLVRTACSTIAENSSFLKDLSFQSNVYRAIKQGFQEGLGDSLSPQEAELLDWAGPVITYEQALRFATDYLLGDRYYPTKSPDENLIRTQNQIELHQQMVQTLGL